MKQGNFLHRFRNYYQTYGLRRLVERSWGVAQDCLRLNTPREQSLAAPPGDIARERRPTATPVLILAGIEWSYRVQRAQQLARNFSRAGSPVFYAEPVFAASREPGWRTWRIEDEARLQRIKFHAPRRLEVWRSEQVLPACGRIKEELAAFIGALNRTYARELLILVQHPSWQCCLPDDVSACVLYDCLDEFSDFSDANPSLREYELRLIDCVRGIVSTSQRLDLKWSNLELPHCIIRNGVDFSHFHAKPEKCYRGSSVNGIIGYHGAIEEWFDVELVEAVAQAFPDYEVALIGGVGDSAARKALRKQANIRLLGEIPYAKLPYYIHGFSVGIVPFRIRPLTSATNPIKVYEYLAAGVPVVSTPLPELEYFDDLVSIADHNSFIDAIRQSLGTDSAVAERRRHFAACNSWHARTTEFYTFHARVSQGQQ